VERWNIIWCLQRIWSDKMKTALMFAVVTIAVLTSLAPTSALRWPWLRPAGQ